MFWYNDVKSRTKTKRNKNHMPAEYSPVIANLINKHLDAQDMPKDTHVLKSELKDQEGETQQTYFDQNKEQLRELVQIAGLEELWSDESMDAALMDRIRGGWIGKEHGYSEEKDQYTGEQVEQMYPILVELGFAGERLPEPGSKFSETVLLGATTPAIMRRIGVVEHAREIGVDVGKEYYLFGERPRMDKDGGNDELLSSEGRFAGNDVSDNIWANNVLKPALEGETRVATEMDFGLLALAKVIKGDMKADRIGLPIAAINGEVTAAGEPLANNDMPLRETAYRHFSTEDGRDITVINGRAVSRGENRPPRPTTTSTIEEWADISDLEEGASVLIVSTNPHADRQLKAVQEVLDKRGRTDVKLSLAAAAPPANQDKRGLVYSCLGEVGRQLEQDNKS